MILGFSEVLRWELFGSLGGGKYSEYIHTSAEHPLALVNDMLDVSAITAGQWRLHRETVAIGEGTRIALSLLEPSRQKGAC